MCFVIFYLNISIFEITKPNLKKGTHLTSGTCIDNVFTNIDMNMVRVIPTPESEHHPACDLLRSVIYLVMQKIPI